MFFFKKKELKDVVCSSLSKMRGNRLKLKKNPRPGDKGDSEGLRPEWIWEKLPTVGKVHRTPRTFAVTMEGTRQSQMDSSSETEPTFYQM